jgi:pimeloyl-ACP methyl ester carboxylesterase
MVLDGRVAEGYEPERLLRQIVCPVLLLQANPALGATMSDKDVSRALVLLAHATHVRFEQLGHFLHLEQAGPVLRAVTNFLESL